MKARCAAKAAAPVRDGTWWSIPPAWPAFRSPRTAWNRRAAPSTTRRVRPWNTLLADRRAADVVATAVDVAETAADAATGAARAGHAGRARDEGRGSLVGQLG